MPDWVALLGLVFPATHGASALLLIDQMDAPLAAIAPSLAMLVILTVVYLGLIALRIRSFFIAGNDRDN